MKKLVRTVFMSLMLTLFFCTSPSIRLAAEEEDGAVFLPVIMYHSLLKDESRANAYTLPTRMFEADMQYLMDNGYTTITAKELIAYVEEGAALPQKPVMVTFDDGHYNNYYYAYPFMRANGLKGVLNIVGRYSENTVPEDSHNPNFSYLTWAEIALLHQSGVFEIGNHTYDMHNLTGSRKGCKRKAYEPLDAYEAELTADVNRLQQILTQKCGITPNVFAYSFGYISEESIPILSELGFKVLLTCHEAPNWIYRNHEEVLLLNRYNRPTNLSTADFMERLLSQDMQDE